MTQFGFSKAFNVAGLRIGYLCITDKKLMERAKLQGIAAGILATNLAKAAGHVMIAGGLNWWLKDMMTHLTKIRSICERWFQ